jgi:hypothetical protein
VPQLSLSLWLPVSRANFYGATDTNWLMRRPGTDFCSSSRMAGAQIDYQPLMLVSVLRRLLEVLPYSFAYNEEGRCTFRGDHSSRMRPASVTMTLDLTDAKLPPPALPEHLHAAWFASEKRANDRLRGIGITQVDLYVDENGAYAFTATFDGSDRDGVRAALLNHIREVFGGTYIVHPDVEDMEGKVHRRFNAGNASLKEYNGINESKEEGVPDAVVGPPLGILNFYQLHVMAEGIWNDTLLPLVYLERREWVKEYLDGVEGYEFLRSMERVIEAITTEADATTTLGKINVLHHFLTVTANTSLQKLRVALESVRRRLLDEMMGDMHRQRRLIQLNLNNNLRERIPELAVAATENQIKGYATLVSAKLPLIMGVREVARLAVEHLEWLVKSGQSTQHDVLTNELIRLDGQLTHWNSLLEELDSAVKSLQTTIEQAWMQELLYEQQQARSDQEALAEIERSRQSRPNFGSPSRSAYQFAMLFFTAVAGIFAVTTVNFDELRAASATAPWWIAAWEILKALWVVWAGLAFLFLVIPGFQHFRRAVRDRAGTLGSYPYEFAFRLDEKLKENALSSFANDRTRYRLTKPGNKHPVHLATRGYGRIERITPDSTIAKVHSTASFRPRRALTYARFEIIYELLIHRGADRTADKAQQYLVQCRMFGESPRALSTDELFDLVQKVAHHVGGRISADGKIPLADLLDETLNQTAVPAARVRKQ